MEQASKYINKFFNSLPKTDNFGLISLQLSSRANELILEEKGKNPHLKELFLRSMFDERTHFQKSDRTVFRRQQLEFALTKAMEWQQSIEDNSERINGHTYYGPHKWIVCILGSDIYPIAEFMEDKSHQIKYTPNLSISVLGLSDEPLVDENSHDYDSLCKMTKEGLYLNIVDKGLKADWLAQTFFSLMEVYPSTNYPIVKEFFQQL